jgi:hypothetical protein
MFLLLFTAFLLLPAAFLLLFTAFFAVLLSTPSRGREQQLCGFSCLSASFCRLCAVFPPAAHGHCSGGDKKKAATMHGLTAAYGS